MTYPWALHVVTWHVFGQSDIRLNIPPGKFSDILSDTIWRSIRHLCWNFIWHSTWHILIWHSIGTLFGILLGKYSDIFSGRLFRFLCGMIQSGNLFGIHVHIYSDIVSYVRFGLCRHSFWHSVWRVFWHLFWHSIWHIFLHSFWQMVWYTAHIWT